LAVGIFTGVFPHLLRHSIGTILLDSGQGKIDQVQKSSPKRQALTGASGCGQYADIHATTVAAVPEKKRRAVCPSTGTGMTARMGVFHRPVEVEFVSTFVYDYRSYSVKQVTVFHFVVNSKA
jgi:hypothetical protein